MTVLLALGILLGLFVTDAQPFAVGQVPPPRDEVAHSSPFAVLAVAVGQGLRG